MLTTKEANETRKVTKVRYVVEVRNGHMKSVWKLFYKIWNPLQAPHLVDDYKIGAALLNKYFPLILSDKNNVDAIVGRMLDMADEPNKLNAIITKPAFEKVIRNFDDFDFQQFPKMEINDLVSIAVGTYQLRLAPSYYSDQIKNNNLFEVFVCKEDDCKRFLKSFYTSSNDPKLLMCRIKRRFEVHKRSYFTFVLFDSFATGSRSILGYCCDCKSGLRTVGCCSHVMMIIWYLSYGQHHNIHKPAGFLYDYFDKNDHNSDIESDFDDEF